MYHMNMRKTFALATAAAVCGIAFGRTEVDPPVLGSTEYDGTVQTATVPVSDKWQIVFSENGEHAGTYDTFLRIVDFDDFKWKGTDARMITVPFTIVPAQNAWTTAPSISGWTFGDTPSTPSAAAKFGAVAPVVYNGVTADGVPVSGAAAVDQAGSYTAVFGVAGCSDYTALRAEVPFTVSRRNVAGGGLAVTVGADPEYNGAAQTLPVTGVTFGGRAVPYSVEGGTATNAGAYTLSVTVGGDYAGSTNIAWRIRPRDISNAVVGVIPAQTETGSPIQPTVSVEDGTPSIISPADYTVAYSGNVNPGTATVTLTGRRNYTGTKMATFTIMPRPAATTTAAALSGEARWKFLKSTGTYFAQLKIRCTEGYSSGISNLRVGFVDRMASGSVAAQFWDSTNRRAVSATFSHGGRTYRVVPLSAASIVGENLDATYGVGSLSAGSVPVGERTIELYVPRRDLASHLGEYVAYAIWESGGVTHVAPIDNKSVQ